MTNDAAKNQVIAYDCAVDGSLGEPRNYDTDGRGNQDGSLTDLGQAGDLPKSVGFNGIAAL